MKKYRLILVSLGLLALIGGVVYWDESQTEKENIAEQAKNKIVAFSAEDVLAIELSSKEFGNVKVEKKDSRWSMTLPLTSAVDSQAIENLLKSVIDYKFEKSLGEKDAKDFGLLEPQVKLQLALKDGKTSTLTLGDKVPVGYSIYFCTSDCKEVFVGSQHLLMSVNKKPSDLRDRTIFTYKTDEILSLSFKSPKTDVFLTRTSEKENFKIEKPIAALADKDGTEDFLSQLASTKATDFVDQPSREIETAFKTSKLAQLKLISKGGEVIEASFTAIKDKLFVKTALGTYQIDAGFKAKLERDLHSFEDKTLVKFSAKELQAMDVNGESYTRKDNQWLAADGKPAKNAKLSQLPSDLEFAKSEAKLNRSTVKSDLAKPPKHQIILKFADPKAETKIEAWQEASGEYLVAVSTSSSIFRVKSATFASLAPSEQANVDLNDAKTLP